MLTGARVPEAMVVAALEKPTLPLFTAVPLVIVKPADTRGPGPAALLGWRVAAKEPTFG